MSEQTPTSTPECQCFPVPSEYWTTHYGAVDPATTHDPNPECRACFPENFEDDGLDQAPQEGEVETCPVTRCDRELGHELPHSSHETGDFKIGPKPASLRPMTPEESLDRMTRRQETPEEDQSSPAGPVILGRDATGVFVPVAYLGEDDAADYTAQENPHIDREAYLENLRRLVPEYTPPYDPTRGVRAQALRAAARQLWAPGVRARVQLERLADEIEAGR